MSEWETASDWDAGLMECVSHGLETSVAPVVVPGSVAQVSVAAAGLQTAAQSDEEAAPPDVPRGV